MTLRRKVLIAQLPLVLTLAVIGAISIRATHFLSLRSEAILVDNYRSVLAAERMQRALEGMDRAAVFVVLGDRKLANAQEAPNRARFDEELSAQQHNITEAGEAEATRRLTDGWRAYQGLYDQVAAQADATEAKRLYFDRLAPQFQAVEGEAEHVLEINQDAMVQKSGRARHAAARVDTLLLLVTWIGLIVGVASSAAATTRILRPLSVLSQASRRIGEGDLEARAQVHGRDEVAALAREFNWMADRLRQYRESSLGELLAAQGAAQAAIDALPDAVVVFDAAGGVLSTNEAAARILRIELRGDLQPLARADPVVREVLERLRAHVLGGKGAWQPKGLEEALRVETPEGLRFLLPHAAPVHSEGQLRGAAIVLQDVTRLQRFDELTSNLVATVAHELRTPLTSLRMAIHLCLELAAGPLTDKQSDLLYAAREDCERIQSMVDDLLDLSRLQSGRGALSLESVGAGELLEAARAAHRGIATEADVGLASEDLTAAGSVQADPQRIQLVFANLVANAVRHSPHGGTVTLRARPAGGAIRFEVADQGPGVPAEYQQRVFEKFFRAPGATGSGAGLGLYIAREVVLAHEGEIGVDSEAGRGATFWFTLPVAGPRAPAA